MSDELLAQQTVIRLARPNASGGHTVERAALLAEGGDFAAIEAWILARGGTPQALAPRRAGRGGGGLHGLRVDAARPVDGPPVRYEIPAGGLG
jgi:hypothetical protein